MASHKFTRRLKRIGGFVTTLSTCIAGATFIVSSAFGYAKVVSSAEACGFTPEVLEKLNSNERAISISPALIIDQPFWAREEVAPEHKGKSFAYIREQDNNAFEAYLPIWWEEANKVEVCLTELIKTDESNAAFVKMAYPDHAERKLELANRIVAYINIQRDSGLISR